MVYKVSVRKEIWGSFEGKDKEKKRKKLNARLRKDSIYYRGDFILFFYIKENTE